MSSGPPQLASCRGPLPDPHAGYDSHTLSTSIATQLLCFAGIFALLTVARFALDPLLQGRAPIFLHMIGLFVIALLVGPGVYIAGTIVALATASFLFVEPRGQLLGSTEALVQVSLYAVGAAVIPAAAWPLRATRLRAVQQRNSIRENEHRFRLALAHSQVTLYTADRSGRMTWVYNPHFALAPRDIIGRTIDELLPQDAADELVALQHEVLESGVPRQRQLTMTLGGRKVTYDAFVDAIFDARHNIIGIAVAASDITASVSAQEQLRAANEQISRLWQQCAVACAAGEMGEWSWNLHTEQITWSSTMCALMGCRSNADASATFTDSESLAFIHPEDHERTRAEARRVITEGGEYRLKLRVAHNAAAAENTRWVEMRGRLEYDRDGQPTSVIGVAFDVSEHHNAEERLTHQNQLLTRSNDDLEDFAYIVSHDLQDPLRGIRNYSTFVLQDDGDSVSSESREKLETITRLADRLGTLLDNLLQYSRVGRTELGICACPLNHIVDAALLRLKPWLSDRNVKVEVEPELPVAHCDPVRMEEVFVNLIANGVKYNESAEKHIRIGVRPDRTVFIQDNGIGIPSHKVHEVFRIFRRLHARDAYGGGTGSGLAITRKIIERHGGSIWAESELGVGSTFCFALQPRCGTSTPVPLMCACAPTRTPVSLYRADFL